jgi:quinol-cytochrome oxidoreductase complex cytochrome b subunit
MTDRTKLVDDINHSSSFKRERTEIGSAVTTNSKRKWYIIGGVVTAVVVVGIILGVTLSGNKDSPTPPSPTKNYYNPYSADSNSINF